MKKRMTATVLTLSLLLPCVSGTAAAAGAPADDMEVLTVADLSEYENNEVLAGYSDGRFEVLAFEDAEALAEGIAALEKDETVTLIQPNYTYESTALSVSDPLSVQQWALSNDGSFQLKNQDNQYINPLDTPQAWRMPGQPGGIRGMAYGRQYRTAQVQAAAGIDLNTEQAWELYNGGVRDVVIALIDTGVDSSHEDLQDILWTNSGEIPGNGIDDDGNGYVDDVHGWNFYNGSNQLYVSAADDSHGTHAAGTIAASANNSVGIAGIVNSGHVKIMVLKALGGYDGGGTTASIIEAIQYAQANGASICNLSLGNSVNDRALYQAMAASTMLFVAAAGNDSADTDISPCYPASYDLDNIISVANLNCDGSLHYSSNYGVNSVDLAAPGSDILSTTPGNDYSYMTGTSMAAPMVTAAAAMVYSSSETITLAGVKEVLLDSAHKLDSLTGRVSTGGMLDLGAAMAYDTKALSGAEWTAVVLDNGSAPVIQTWTETQSGRTYLTVQVTDVDNDLWAAAYASGTLTAPQFYGGCVGRSLSLDSSGTVKFAVNGSGTYTFYAVDSMGNETVETVTVTGSQTAAVPTGGGTGWNWRIRWRF